MTLSHQFLQKYREILMNYALTIDHFPIKFCNGSISKIGQITLSHFALRREAPNIMHAYLQIPPRETILEKCVHFFKVKTKKSICLTEVDRNEPV